MWQLVHLFLISVHAAAGGTAFLVGLVAMRRPGTLVRTFTGTITVMALAVAAAVAAAWPNLGTTSRVVSAAFVVLAGYMVWRALAAVRIAHRRAGEIPERYYDLLGFDLVALFDAFVVIALLDLGVPTWGLVLAGVGVAVPSHVTLLRQAARRATQHTTRRPVRA